MPKKTHMSIKKLLLLAFVLTLSLTKAQTAKEMPEFPEDQVREEAFKKGLPPQDVEGFVRAAKVRHVATWYKEQGQEFKRERVTVAELGTNRIINQTIQTTQCQNSDFSMLNYSNWTGDIATSESTGSQYPVASWLGTGINGNNGSGVIMNTDPCNGINVATDYHVIMNMPWGAIQSNNLTAFTNGYDPSCCNSNIGSHPYDLPMTPYNGGTSIRLGSAYPNYTCEKLRYNMTVNPNTTQFTYRFAVVINDGGHGIGEQPAFLFAMRDSVGNLLAGNPACVKYDIDATAALGDTSYIKNWFSNPCSNSGGGQTSYRKWHTVTIDLTSFINHTIYAEFQALDCIWSGHFCYAYISANCGALSANVSGFCGGSGSVTMTAPGGFATYQWYGPNNSNPIAGATSYSYTAAGAVNGDVFSVDCITLQGCTTKLNVTVAASNIVATGVATPSCRGGANGTASVSVLGGTQYTYSWTPSGLQTASISGQPPGSYSVLVHDISTAQCPDTVVVVNIGQINPPLQTAVDTLCGTQVVLSAPSTSPYTWYDNTNTVIPGATSQSYTVNPGAGGQHYTVTYKDPITGCLDSLKKTLTAVTISFNVVQSPPCNSGSNGSITITSNVGNTFPIYDWNLFGSPSGSGTNVAMPPNPIQIPNLPQGTWTVSIHPTGNTTCSYTTTVSLVQGVFPPPTLDTLKGCALDNISVPTTTVSGSTHMWYNASGVFLNSNYPYTTTGVTQGAVYTDTIRSAAGCKSVYKAYLKLKSFKLVVTAPEKEHCHNDSSGKIKVTANQEINGPLGTPYTFNWNFPNPYPDPAPINAGTGVPQSTQMNSLHAGTYTCVVTSGNCVATATYNLTNPALLPYDSLFSYFCPKDSIVWLFAEPGHSSYNWLHNGVSVSPVNNNDSIAVTPTTVGDYWVVYKQAGCLDTARILFTFPSFHAFRPDKIVNIFTPNDDKKNDFFYPFYDSNSSAYQIDKQMESYYIVIYNRWGKKIFETNEYAKPWNGKDENGVLQDDGTYYWILNYKSNCSTKADIVNKHGFVQLLR